ncbi:MAG: phospholipid/cholesterol/gamma-HCH transport system substrate-binding protein [Pseudonocardiales bacterium]|nr:phospholipid/cholesterol/gamma-HCH transport system substrate-binding protein [Pseudonocardiales bacterium]
MAKLVIKVAALFGVAGLMSLVMVTVFGNVRIEDASTYKALFTDVSGLTPGSDVRAAGVTVGRVQDVELEPSNDVLVSFSVQNAVPLGIATHAAVRYKNLVGDRYLDLSDAPGPSERLRPGDTIPVTNTAPALDLDELYNGFTPLLEGLAPDQVNQLSSALIGAFQGEGPAIDNLLTSVGSLTGTLAERDQMIGQLIDHFNTVLTTVNERSPQLVDLINQLQRLISGLAAERGPIGQSLVQIGDLTGNVGGLLAHARPDLAGTIDQVDRLTGVINSDRDTVNTTLNRLPRAYEQLGRLGAYGSFFQFYICGIQIRTTGPDGRALLTPWVSSGVERCQ